MKVTNLGYRPDNDLRWRDVYCQQEGTYQITIRHSSFPEEAALYIALNDSPGMYFTARNAEEGLITFPAVLKAGYNTIRLYNDHGPMPEVDWMKIIKK